MLNSSCCRKRTKKSTAKAGRKKAKKGDSPTPEQSTPNTRARAAKEAAIKARLEAEQAKARAREAVEAAEAASRAVLNSIVPCELVPVPVVLPEPPNPSGPLTRRYKSKKNFVSTTKHYACSFLTALFAGSCQCFMTKKGHQFQKCSMNMCSLLLGRSHQRRRSLHQKPRKKLPSDTWWDEL